MRKSTFLFFIICFVLLLFLVTSRQSQTVFAPENHRDTITESVRHLSLEQKLGQLFLLGLSEPVSLEAFLPLVREGRIGGFIIMGGNVRGTEKLPETIAVLQRAAASTSPATAPLFVATDQEGGAISRFQGVGFIRTAQAELPDADTAYETARRRGQELRGLGVNMNFSPVMDEADPTSFLYKRTFRGTQEEIALLGGAMVRGYRDGGIIPVPKHFPGHPRESTDSHKVLPQAQGDSAWFREHIRQFTYLLNEEKPDVLMTAHVLYPSIDSVPATLSSVILTDTLRDSLDFGGVIVTDDLNMGALRSSFSLAESTVRALEAGNDMLLIVGTRQDLQRATEAVRGAIESGRITESRIDESVTRLIRLKGNL